MPAALVTREETIDRLFEVFRDRGFDGASMADLAAATRLGKSSLYHYFPGGKEDMARAVLARGMDWIDEHVVATLRGSGTPGRRVDRMIAALDGLYASGRHSCLLGTFALGASGQRFRRELRNAFSSFTLALSETLQEAGVPPSAARTAAEDALLAIEGSLVLASGTGDPSAFQRTLRELPRRLLPRPPRPSRVRSAAGRPVPG